MAQSQGVLPLSNDQEIENKLTTNNKLLVFEMISDDYKMLCNKMTEPFNKLAKDFEGKAEFYKLDLNNCQNFARAHKLQVYPSFVLMEDGKEVDVVIGVKPGELRKAIAAKTTGFRC